MTVKEGIGLALAIVVLAAIATLFVLAIDVFAVLFLALLFGVFLTGLSRIVSAKTSLRYSIALSLVVLAFLVIVIGSGTLFGVRVQGQLDRAETRFKEGVQKLQKLVTEQPTLHSILSTTPLTEQLLKPESGSLQEGMSEDAQTQQNKKGSSGEQSTSTIRNRLVQAITSLARTTFGFLINTLLIFFVGIYLAANPEMYVNGVASLFPSPNRSRVKEVMRREYEVLWRWTIGRLLAMTVTGVLTGLTLWLLGVPMPWMLGLLTGLLVFIPNIGAAIALAVAVLFALTESSTLALWVVPSYLAIQLVESYAITPLIQQHQTAAPPAALLSLQAVLGVVIGLLGAMIASPLLVATKTLVEETYIKKVP